MSGSRSAGAFEFRRPPDTSVDLPERRLKSMDGRQWHEFEARLHSYSREQGRQMGVGVSVNSEGQIELKEGTAEARATLYRLIVEMLIKRGRDEKTDVRASASIEPERYQRKKIGGSVVMVLEDEPEIYYCRTCLEAKQQAIPLQLMPHSFRMYGSHTCPQCKAHLALTW